MRKNRESQEGWKNKKVPQKAALRFKRDSGAVLPLNVSRAAAEAEFQVTGLDKLL